MTLTEKNQMQYDLRQKMYHAQARVEYCKQQIAKLERDYKESLEPDLFTQMFGEQVKVPTIYTDTPMAEEFYGG